MLFHLQAPAADRAPFLLKKSFFIHFIFIENTLNLQKTRKDMPVAPRTCVDSKVRKKRALLRAAAKSKHPKPHETWQARGLGPSNMFPFTISANT